MLGSRNLVSLKWIRGIDQCGTTACWPSPRGNVDIAMCCVDSKWRVREHISKAQRLSIWRLMVIGRDKNCLGPLTNPRMDTNLPGGALRSLLSREGPTAAYRFPVQRLARVSWGQHHKVHVFGITVLLGNEQIRLMCGQFQEQILAMSVVIKQPIMA